MLCICYKTPRTHAFVPLFLAFAFINTSIFGQMMYSNFTKCSALSFTWKLTRFCVFVRKYIKYRNRLLLIVSFTLNPSIITAYKRINVLNCGAIKKSQRCSTIMPFINKDWLNNAKLSCRTNCCAITNFSGFAFKNVLTQ